MIDSAATGGVQVTGGAQPRLEGCEISGTPVGLLVEAGSRVEGTDLKVRGARTVALRAVGESVLVLEGGEVEGGGAGTGLEVSERAEARLSGVRLHGTGGTALDLAGGARVELSSCVFRGWRAQVGTDGRLTARESEFTGSDGDGVTVAAGGTLTAVGCRITGAHGHGLHLQADARAELTNCALVDNGGDGVRSSSDQPVLLHQCEVRDNGGSALREVQPARPERPQARPRSADPGPAPHPGTGPLADLEGLVGLESVKREVTGLINLNKMAQRRQEMGLPMPPMSRHLVFAGPREPARPPWPGSTGRSWPSWASSARAISSRWPAPTWSPRSSAAPPSRPPRCSPRRWAACCSSTRRTPSPTSPRAAARTSAKRPSRR
ncbi:hypothetical protein GXW82_14400 [Streptacidiphilus sp. 4-A2]|nr:hypothetical protein [Streptacidiphilus sp. 4-A2]